MSLENNKNAIRDLFAAMDAAQNMSALDAIAAPDYMAHFPGMPSVDLEGVKAFGSAFYQACPGLRHSMGEVIAEGDYAVAHFTVVGTHTQPLVTPGGAIPAYGKAFEMEVLNLYRFKDGKVVDHTSVFDMLGFMQQIGAIPAPEASAA